MAQYICAIFFLFKFAHVQNRTYIATDFSHEITNIMAKSLTVREKKAAKFAILNLKNDTLTVHHKNGTELCACKKDHEKRGAFSQHFGAHKFKLGDHLLFVK